MCELDLPDGTPVYRRRTTDKLACPDCLAIQNRALSELREQDRRQQALQPLPRRQPTGAYRSRYPMPRARIVPGGLPTLGRDR